MTDTKKQHLLRRLKLDRVDLVPRGANPEAHIAFYKTSDGTRYDSRPDGSPNEENAVSKTIEELQTALDEATAARAKADEELEAMTDERDDAVDKAAATPAAEMEKVEAKLVEAEAALDEARGEPDVQKQLDETKETLAKLEKERRTESFIRKAEKFSELGTPEMIGGLLDAADQHFTEEQQKVLASLLAGAAEQVEKGNLFAQLADPDASPGEGWEERLAKAAAERVTKSEGGLTIEQAKAQIITEDRDLQREHYESVRS
jgi:hypothetical protein